MQANAKQRRPASHRWAIGLFGFMTAGLAVLLSNAPGGQSGESAGIYESVMPFFLVVALGFVSLVLGGRRSWAYYVGSVTLGVWCAQSVATTLRYLHQYIRSGGELSAPSIRLIESAKPLVVPQDVTVAHLVVMVVAVSLMIWLFMRFAFGQASRRYYGFDIP